ncbi:MAG: glycosyltransferase family 9 protein [Terracidiphilus sp.]|jgi:heptosyltransferase I
MRRGSATNRLLDYYLGIPVLNLLASLRRKRSCPEYPNKIGILLNPAVGDTLLASAAVREIRAFYPKAELILFATKANISAAKLVPEINRIELLAMSRPCVAIQSIRRCALDLMLDFTSWQRITALYALLSGARFTVGFERAGQYRHRGFDRTVSHRNDCHELENIRRLTSSFGTIKNFTPQLFVPDSSLPKFLLHGGEVIIFHAWASGARSWLREWPNASWVELALRLRKSGRLFLITGSPTDEIRCKTLQHTMLSHGVSAEVRIGWNGISEIARLLAHAKMLITVNTGIMHLGAILKVPTIAINGPTAVHRWGPIGPRVANVCPRDGSGGFLDLGFEYHGHLENVMKKISVDDVILAAQQLFYKSINANIMRGSNLRLGTDELCALMLDGKSWYGPHFQIEENLLESQ